MRNEDILPRLAAILRSKLRGVSAIQKGGFRLFLNIGRLDIGFFFGLNYINRSSRLRHKVSRES